MHDREGSDKGAEIKNTSFSSRLDMLGLVERVVENELTGELGVRGVADGLRAADLPGA